MTTILYEQDYYLWLEKTAKLLRDVIQTQNFAILQKLDIPNLIEEIEDMGKSQKYALKSNLRIILMHLLKHKYQSNKRSNSWKYTLREHRKRLRDLFQDSPSLKRYFVEVFDECYQDARELAADETGLQLSTFPTQSPFTPEKALNQDYLPNELT